MWSFLIHQYFLFKNRKIPQRVSLLKHNQCKVLLLFSKSSSNSSPLYGQISLWLFLIHRTSRLMKPNRHQPRVMHIQDGRRPFASQNMLLLLAISNLNSPSNVTRSKSLTFLRQDDPERFFGGCAITLDICFCTGYIGMKFINIRLLRFFGAHKTTSQHDEAQEDDYDDCGEARQNGAVK